MSDIRLLLLLLLAVAMGAAWMLRLSVDAVSQPPPGEIIITDRWTGSVYVCRNGFCLRHYPANTYAKPREGEGDSPAR